VQMVWSGTKSQLLPTGVQDKVPKKMIG